MKFTSLFTLLILILGVYTVNAQSPSIVGTSPTNKNVVLEELTGKTCQYCPDGHKRAAQLRANNPGRVLLLNIHTGSYAQGTPNYRSAWGDYVGALFSVSGYPTGTVNRRDFGSGVMTSRGDWTSNASTIMGQSSPMNVGANASINLDNRQMIVDVEGYYTSAGTGSTNKMHVIITQDNIPGPQTGGATWYPAMILPNGDYNHMHMVRHNLSPNAGETISAVTATSLYTNQYTYTLPANYNAITVNLADMLVVAYASEAASTAEIVTGAEATMSYSTATPLGASTTIAELDASLGSVCGTTVDATWQITNTGNDTLTTATFQYIVNSGTPGTYQHTFATPLATGQYEVITIPAIPGLSPNGATSNVDLSITLLNSLANPNTNATNGLSVTTSAIKSESVTSVSLSLTTDNYGSETDWELVDETTGSTVMQGGGYSNVTGGQTLGPFNGTLVNGHCYKFQITDTWGDGICCTYGNGSYTLTVGSTTFVSGGSFASMAGEKFVFDLLSSSVGVQNSADAITIMPNPVRNNMTLQFTIAEMNDLNINIYNALGQQVQQVANGSYEGMNTLEIATDNLSSGVYFLNITSQAGTSTKRFVVEK